MNVLFSAQWLDTFFTDYDYAILSALHALAEWGGAVLTPLMRLITLTGEKGIAMFVLAFVFILFKKTRRVGVCIFGAVCCGALITNVILKDTVERVRPMMALAEYAEWWNYVGAPVESGFSFPSGHVTAITAGMIALCLCCGKNYIVPAAISVVLMGVSRSYLMAHYPSDVLAAMIIGALSAAAAYLIASLIYKLLEKHRDVVAFGFVLDADVRELFVNK